jgi:predicted ATP-dependent serine protease
MCCVVRRVDAMLAKTGSRIKDNALIVSGNPGIGKTTLLSLILERIIFLEQYGCIFVAHFADCLQYCTATARWKTTSSAGKLRTNGLAEKYNTEVLHRTHVG